MNYDSCLEAYAMDIVCKQCNTTYTIPARKLPRQRASAECKRCGYKIIIQADAAPSALQADGMTADTPVVSKASPPGTGSEILEAFPELAHCNTTRYNLDELIVPTKKGNYKTRLNKFKVKILEAVCPILDRMLQDDEQVLCIASGIAHYLVEMLFGNGVLTMLYNRYALVATNRRVLMINTNYRITHPRHYLFQFTYDEIKKISRGLFRTSLTFTLHNGRRRTITSMKSASTRQLLNLIKQRIDLQKTPVAAADIKSNLCPACFTPLGKGLAQCPACQAAFKTPAGAALRSLVLPGLGDFFLGHRFLGCTEMIGSVVVWLFALSMLLAGGTDGGIIAVLMLVFVNGFDALLTLHMGKKGYILAKKQPASKSRPQLATSGA